MRTFLQDIKIIGAMLISREGNILHYTIPSLLRWCDWVLIILDNENKESRRIAQHYRGIYPNRIRIARSGFPRATQRDEMRVRGLFQRFKKLQGPIRETVFKYLRNCLANGEKIDILVFPDADEIFSDYFPKLLNDFWKNKKVKAITLKPVGVYGDIKTIMRKSMSGHTRVMKFFPELTAIPYRTLCCYKPLTRKDRMAITRVLIHLAHLTSERKNWRKKHWKFKYRPDEPLWKLDKDINKMSPLEIGEVFKRKPDLTIKEYE